MGSESILDNFAVNPDFSRLTGSYSDPIDQTTLTPLVLTLRCYTWITWSSATA